MKRENDIIKALGFVALYAAYLEEGIDIVMERLSAVKEITDKEKKWPTSQKIKWCKTVLNSLQNDDFKHLLYVLDQAKCLLERRNEVVHGRIYAGNDRSDKLKSGRHGLPEREVTAGELYDLADEIFNIQATIPNINYFTTMRAIAEIKDV
jgi:hypothetical protein